MGRTEDSGRRSNRFRLPILLLLLLSLQAAGSELRPGLRLIGMDAQDLMYAPQLRTDVEIGVSGMLVRVSVVQRFTNPSSEWVEGVYVFPLPAEAAVDRLRMRYGGRLIEGEIQERQQARRQYEQARAAGHGASLLDQQRANVFTTSVANIPPGEMVQVEIEYQQQARWQGRGYSLRFPMVVAPRYIPGVPLRSERSAAGAQGWAVNTDQVADAGEITPPVVAGAGPDLNPVSIRVELDAGLALADIDSPYHAISIEQVAAGRYRLALRDGPVPADRDFVLRWYPALGAEPAAALFSQQWRDAHYGLLMLMPPHAADNRQAVPRELILVVDTSGSMHGDSIAQARAALELALQQLRPGDRFNVIQFNDRPHSLFEHAVTADPEHLRRARAYVRTLRAEGGTEMLPAMRHALRDQPRDGLLRQVVFLTDGAIGNEQALFDTIAERLGDSRLFTIGIGSAPNALFMRKAARFGRGTFAYIGSTQDVQVQMARLFQQLSAPVLTDVRLRWETVDGRPVDAQAPQRIPDLYADEPLVVAVRAPTPLSRARVSGMLGTRPWTHTADLGGGATSDSVHVLWARRMIDDWLARLSLGGNARAVRDAVSQLALEHHLVSRYTSLVAVDRTPSRPLEQGLQSAGVPTRLPAGWSATAVFGRLPGTATPAALYLLAGLAGLAIAVVVRRHA